MNALRCQHSTSRGFAMLLILITLAIGTILATAYLASRDNSAVIGANATAGASARAAALATINSGIAILETETDWRTNHSAGVVFSNVPFAGASVDLILKDLVTGAPPTSSSTDIELTAVARVADVEERVVAHAFVPPPDDEPDLDLSEFAIFVKDKLTIKDTSLIARWNTSPRSVLRKPLALGTLSKDAAAIALSDYAVAVDGIAYVLPGSSSLLVSNDGPAGLPVMVLPDTIVMPNPPNPGTLAIGLSTDFSRDGSANSFTVTNDRRVRKLNFKNGAVLTLRGPLTLIADDTITIEKGSKISVEGDVKIVAYKDARFKDDALIELQNGASLTFFVKDDLEIDDAAIVQAGAQRNASGDAAWMNPARATIYALPSSSGKTWTIKNDAIVKGMLYSPAGRVRVDQNSAVFGRIAAQEVSIEHGSALYYDHTLDTGNGFTVFTSPVYDSNGKVRPAIKTLTSLDNDLIDTVNGIIRALEALQPPPGPNEPTPRTVHVTYEIVSLSRDTANWESKASLIAMEE